MNITGDTRKRKIYRRPVIRDSYIEIPLGVGASGGFTKVDKQDSFLAERLWHKSSKGYVVITGLFERAKHIYMHHLIVGKPPTNMVVDHINRDPLDNRRSNLRIAPYSINNQNRGLMKNNTTGYVGVRYGYSSWTYTIRYHDLKVHKSGFSSAYDAYTARQAVLREYNKELL